MREGQTSVVETVVGIAVAVAVAAQTWVLIQEATQGDAGRQVSRWWTWKARPQVVRVVAWLDARALTERMCSDEIMPFLEREAT